MFIAGKVKASAKYWLDAENFDLIKEYHFNMSPKDHREIRRILFEHFNYIEDQWEKF